MPLCVHCPSGHKLIVPDDRAGRLLRCPRCDETFVARLNAAERERGSRAKAQESVVGTLPMSGPATAVDAALTALSTEHEPPPGTLAEVVQRQPTSRERPPPPIEPPAKPKSRAIVLPEERRENKFGMPIPASPPEVEGQASSNLAPPAEPVVAEQPSEPAAESPAPPREEEPAAPPVPPEASCDVATEVLAEEAPPLVVPPIATEPVATTAASTSMLPQAVSPDPHWLPAVYLLAAGMIVAALFSIVPAVWDVVEYVQIAESPFVARWAFVLFTLALVQIAFAVLLIQVPDWTSVWVSTLYALALAALYALVLGLVLISRDDGLVVRTLQLSDKLAGGKALLWCLAMVSLSTMLAFFAGRLSVQWRRAESLLRRAGL